MRFMTRESSIKHITICESVLGVIFLICGCSIYLLFRSTTLNIYQWCSAIGFSTSIDAMREYTQTWDLPDFVRYCLPDGLYCAAYLLIMDAVWKGDKSLLKYTVLSIVPFVTISSELLQYGGFVPGTFDPYDLLCYSIPPTVYIICDMTNNVHQLTCKQL